MNGEHRSENHSDKARDLLVSDILRVVFAQKGIEFKSAILLRWKVSDDKTSSQPIITLQEFVTLLQDGSYQFAITGATISDIEKEAFKVPAINVEVGLENGQWSEPRIYTDFEYFGAEYDTPQRLYGRLQQIKEKFKEICEFLSLLLRIAEILRHLFS